jgi:hypothetical protein
MTKLKTICDEIKKKTVIYDFSINPALFPAYSVNVWRRSVK